MGVVYADIELINEADVALVKRNIIGADEVRHIRLSMMAINESIQSQMDFSYIDKREVRLSNGQIEEYDVVGPIGVRFSNRRAICSAFVLPGDSEPLLGAIPMEEMDVLINPKRQELVVNPEHPDHAILRL